jgi:hypothetical protein
LAQSTKRPFHAVDQIQFRRFLEKIDAIAHQHPSMQLPTAAFANTV